MMTVKASWSRHDYFRCPQHCGSNVNSILIIHHQSMGTLQSIKAPGWAEPAHRLRYMAVRLTDPPMGVGKD